MSNRRLRVVGTVAGVVGVVLTVTVAVARLPRDSVVVESNVAATPPSDHVASSAASDSPSQRPRQMEGIIVGAPVPGPEDHGGWRVRVELSDGEESSPSVVDVVFGSKHLSCVKRQVPFEPWELLAGMHAKFSANGEDGTTEPPTVFAARLVVNCDLRPLFANSGWDVAAPGPADGRVFPAIVWTDTELIVWGGERPSETNWHRDGAAYSPSTDSWRQLAPSPLSARSEHVAVWTGSEMIVCCGRIEGSGAATAAYDPTTDRWREMPPPLTTSVAFPIAVWTGREMIVTGGVTAGGINQSRTTVAYDPATDEWRRLADVPVDLERTADAVWTGELMVVWPSSGGPGWTYDPTTDDWDRLPAAPQDASPVAASLVWTGTEVIAVGASHRHEGALLVAAAYTPGLGEWRTLDTGLPPAKPFEGSNGSQAAVWTGREVLVWAGYLGNGISDDEGLVLAYTPADDTWRQLPPSPVVEWRPPIALAGDRLLVYGTRGVQVLRHVITSSQEGA